MSEDSNEASVQSVVHTPGPWRQGGVKENFLIGKCREIVADDGRIGLVYGITDEDCKANARLVEAAPELLAALEHMRWCQSCADGSWEDCECGRMAIDAIKKAKGE